jgi:hypothetical protein
MRLHSIVDCRLSIVDCRFEEAFQSTIGNTLALAPLLRYRAALPG